MENPRKEITGVVKGLCSAKDAGQQRNVIQRYFTPDASFDHPLCAVQSYPGSRDKGVLPIYQWLRTMFMDTLIQVHDIESNKMFLRISQTLRCNLAIVRCLRVPTVEIVVLLDLVKSDNNKYLVSRQTDYYAVQMVPHIVIPYSKDIIIVIKVFVGYLCAIFAAIFQIFGFWVPPPK